MKKLALAIAVLLVSFNAYADGTAHKKGNKSLNFSFNSLTVEEYKMGIGGNYFIANDQALRASVNWGNSKTTTAANTTTKFNQNAFSVGIVNYLPLSTHLSPYFGGEISNFRLNTTTSPANTDATTKGYTVSGVLGLEYQFNSNVSFAAEYLFGYGYSKASTSTNGVTTSESTTRSIGLGAEKLMVMFFF